MLTDHDTQGHGHENARRIYAQDVCSHIPTVVIHPVILLNHFTSVRDCTTAQL